MDKPKKKEVYGSGHCHYPTILHCDICEKNEDYNKAIADFEKYHNEVIAELKNKLSQLMRETDYWKLALLLDELFETKSETSSRREQILNLFAKENIPST